MASCQRSFDAASFSLRLRGSSVTAAIEARASASSEPRLRIDSKNGLSASSRLGGREASRTVKYPKNVGSLLLITVGHCLVPPVNRWWRAAPSHERPIDSHLGCGHRRRSGLLIARYDHALRRRGPLPVAALLNHHIFDASTFHCQRRLYIKIGPAFRSTALIAISASLIRCRTPPVHAVTMASAAVDWTSSNITARPVRSR